VLFEEAFGNLSPNVTLKDFSFSIRINKQIKNNLTYAFQFFLLSF